MERDVEGKKGDFLLEGSPYGRYYTGLRCLGVLHPDAMRATSKLAEVKDLSTVTEIAGTVFTVGNQKFEWLHSIGQNPYVERLENYLAGLHKGTELWCLVQETVDRCNQLLNPAIPFLTLPDLIHPVESATGISVWGAYRISEGLSRLTGIPIQDRSYSLGRGLDYAIGGIIWGRDPWDKAFNDHLKKPLEFFGKSITMYSGLFVVEVLLPIRQQVVNKFFERR